ncbi:MAG: exosortase system-associated protein, TIGR04073 family [Akkermansiaceae bacterium]|nr:exosortase system-associated protein, TIGR04073 family [Akkermansiaceae bacterium]
MKKLLVFASAFLALSMAAPADIQNPPGAQYTPTRKLGRALGNILYGWVEIPEQMARKTRSYGHNAGYSWGVVEGFKRTGQRLGYGFLELVTFYAPTNSGTFRPMYKQCGKDNRIEMNHTQGLSEFPPELGFESYYSHTRVQRY